MLNSRQPILFRLFGVHLNTAGTGIRKRGVAPNFCGGRLLPAVRRILSGLSKDSAGAILGNCQVLVFRTESKVLVAETISDAAGAWSVGVPDVGPYFLVEYKVGSPDVAGSSVNTLAAPEV